MGTDAGMDLEMKAESCPVCGARFACGAQTSDCWCMRFSLAPERRAQLASAYERCLCPNCLWASTTRSATRATRLEDLETG